MKSTFLVILLLTGFHSVSQQKTYVEYYKLINKAEELFVTKKDSSCFHLYDMAFAKNKPFLKDPFIAAQIALYLKDTLRFEYYLGLAFKNGMPIQAVTASKLIRDNYHPVLYKSIPRIYKQHFKSRQVDSVLLDRICQMCYQSDSLKLKVGGESLPFYQNENETRAFLLDSLLKKGVFANEQLLGITANELWEHFYRKFNRTNLYEETSPGQYEERELRLKCPMNILLHSQCFFRENKSLLYQALLNGYLHPKDYGILEEASVLWFKESTRNPAEKCKLPAERISYNIFGTDPTSKVKLFDASPDGIKQVEINRSRIYMQKYSVDKLKKELELKYGFAFFFDFIDRP